jgi:eukaryotic-like serine/threonine-protein kinase
MGYSAKALAEAQSALKLSNHLPQEERLLVEGQYREAAGDWPKAVETYESLFNLFPDNLDYGLRLAVAQRRVKSADSVRTLAILRHMPPPAGDDPRIDMNEASAWINQDFAKAHAAAERAIEKGKAQGAHLLVARSYGILCQQETPVGVSTAQTISDCESARQSYAAEGDSDNEARTLSDFAVLYFQQGDLARAEAMWREANKVFREVGDIEGVAASLNNLGDALMSQGSLSEARKLLLLAIPNYQATEDKDGVGRVQNDLAEMSRQQGDLKAAEESYQQAKSNAEEIDDKSLTAYVSSGMGDIFMDRSDFDAARKSYEQSLKVRSEIGESQTMAETNLALAQLSIEEGHPADAETAARKCKEQFHQQQQADDELIARAVLTQALLAQGNQAGAKAEVASAAPLASKNQNHLVGLQFSLVSVRVALASSQPQSSRAQLEEILNDAKAHGLLEIEWEAMLSLAELEKKMGHLAAAHTQFASLAKAAHTKGFDLIAHKAGAAR